MKILATVVLLWITVSTGAIRGVQEKNKQFYELQEKFRCLDGSFEIPAKHVNDEYCDCPDGSDEPGTPACTFGNRFEKKLTWRFQCTDTSYMTKEISHNHVNDMICDCCDGSDEYSGSVSCPNTCAEAQKKAAAEQAEREVKRQQGLKVKQELIIEAQAQRTSLKQSLESIQEKVASLVTAKTEAEQRKKDIEAVEESQRAEIKLRSEDALEKWKAEQAELAATKKDEVEPSDTVICSKWRQTKDCVGTGDRQPEDDKDCEAIISDGWSGFCDCFDTVANVEVRYDFDCGHKPLKCSFVCSHAGAEPEKVDGAKDEEPKVDDGRGYQNADAVAARQEFRDREKALEEAERQIKETENDLARDFGPDDVLLSLKGKCFELDQREYSYKMCPFADVQQVRKGHSHGTVMGRWKGFGEQTYSSWGSKQDYSHFLFSDGEHCWGGPHRSTDVHVVCGSDSRVLSVEEPSMCTYKMVFETPAACE